MTARLLALVSDIRAAVIQKSNQALLNLRILPARFDGRECHEVVLEDTVLFPEGGGQVCSAT